MSEETPDKARQEAFAKSFFGISHEPTFCLNCKTPIDWTQDGWCRACTKERHIKEGILNPDGSDR